MEDERVEVHPHNEYLQVFHDFGIVGLALFLYAWVTLLLRSWRGWTQAARDGQSRYALWSMATVLGVLAMMAYGIVGNGFHYVFVLVPLFIYAACADDMFRKTVDAPRPAGALGGGV